MSTGIQSKGVDLDNIFDPYVTGTSPGLTGVQAAGADVHTRYAPLVYGTQAAATGILCKVGGAGSFVDLNTLFAAKGTAHYSLPINGTHYSFGDTAHPGGSATCSLTFTLNTDGTYTVVSYCKNRSPTTITNASGTWNTMGGPSSGYQVLYTLSSVVAPSGVTTSNSASSYTSLASTQAASITANAASTAGSINGSFTLRIQIKQISTGTVVSDTTIYFAVEADGSV